MSPPLAELAAAGATSFDVTWPYETAFVDQPPSLQRRVVLLALSGRTSAPPDLASALGATRTPPADVQHQADPTAPAAPADAVGWTSGIAAVIAAIEQYLALVNIPAEFDLPDDTPPLNLFEDAAFSDEIAPDDSDYDGMAAP